MPTPLYFNYQDLRFNTNLQALEYNSGNEVWVEVPVPTGAIGLANGKILVGNGSNLAAPVTMSGGATISNTGVVTLAAPALTTLHTFAGVGGVATDNSILQVDVANTAVGVNVAPSAGTALKVHGPIFGDSVISATGEVGSSAGFVLPGGGYIRSTGTQLLVRTTFDSASSIVLQDSAQSPCLTIDTAHKVTVFAGAPNYPTSTNGAATGTVTPASAYGVVTYLYTVSGALTINGPANGYDGQKVVFRILNDASHSVTFATGAGNFRFGTTITSYTNSVSLTDYIGCIWNAAGGVWDIVSISQGF